MVQIPPPPPPKNTPPNPLFHVVPAGSRLVRIFDPTSHGATATSFRTWGPLARFDHHRGDGPKRAPGDDPDRGIYYAAYELSSCMVERFGDTKLVDVGNLRVGYPSLTRALKLLDLRRNGAMRAGSVFALGSIPERPATQEWSRYFYENPSIYSEIDGLIYANAHNGEDAIALYERAEGALACTARDELRLDNPDPDFQARIAEIMLDNNLFFN